MLYILSVQQISLKDTALSIYGKVGYSVELRAHVEITEGFLET